jgi:hypothetical protein
MRPTQPTPICATTLVLLAALALLAASSAAAVAADPTPAPDPAAAADLPPAAAFGPDWSLVHTGNPPLSPEVFRGGALGVYAGPAGARVLAVVMLVTDSRVAVRRSWEEATDLFHQYSGELTYDRERSDVLDRLPPPPGCVEAKRIDGTARQLGLDTGIPMGLTLCAADPDVVLLVVASGPVGALTGYEASDAVASLILRAAPPATPVPR